MKNPVAVAACQLPEIRGDLEGAMGWVEAYAARAAASGAVLVCFPECFLTGYLVEESSARTHALDLTSGTFRALLRRLAALKPVMVIGLIEVEAGVLYNTAVVVSGGQLLGKYRKVHLLAGERIFRSGTGFPVFAAQGLIFGINICYDTQFPAAAAALRDQGAKLIVCPSNNMMRRTSAEAWKDRHNDLRFQRVRETGLYLLSSDVTGTHGDRIGLGPTCLLDPDGRIAAQVPLHEIGIIVTSIAAGT